ncbi:NAD-dependent epimerase/dehydratase family protein [Novosphingobium album (ex Liu et al. 2023)]|uniref:NAD-dependent epimerase/dehydratase family protein n=1 Tax=Novosphingobium album (ex Liu et al. 2023) TaxID=3031130 RepID=A0ABT5WRI1_9SPHN|nr:NAD-dependent epimerase/dehydratase family protein [Novosphingobium album (ex Liu et al. 2023)]MDE8652346.1 NAD-dependent epimerase/dehydratase family protein [Novosphingobium album (ex Liu et al. 2023)]
MILAEDLNAVTCALAPLWPRLDGARIFMTGGTGFIGRWMLEALARSGAAAEVVLLSRDPAGFAARAPHLAAGVEFVTGDTASFAFPQGRFTHVIHGATDASAALTASDPCRMFDTIVGGTRRVLDFAMASGAPRVLFMSSGAVYGAQPADVPHVAEDWMGGPDPRDPRSAYAEGKRAAETLCAIHGRQFGLDIVTARIFALLGPLLTLDIHFAAGNFIRDAIAGRTIRVESSGEAVRSYLYAADLAVWLWTLLVKAAPGAVYNMGSEEAVSIAELAQRTASVLGGPGVEVLGQPDPGWNPGRYVPSTAAIRRDLGVTATIGLDEAIRRTALSNGWIP